ncbi:hypothetical protein V6N13_063912 [Hibiscus sabdariffa]|uniref:Uncharacterized protein n=1 Tax=Hibiscus sabdariffa TaxID=183260 RepID=A0ABR2R1M1_9ROSI
MSSKLSSSSSSDEHSIQSQVGLNNATRRVYIVAKNVVGLDGQVGTVSARSQIRVNDRVSGSKSLNVIQTSNRPVAVQDQADSALDIGVVRASPLGSSSWAESVDLVNNALIQSQNREGCSSSQSEEEKENLAEDFIPEDFDSTGRFRGTTLKRPFQA